MQKKQTGFDEDETIHKLKHYLPSQSPLKDFIHHNTLHAFQEFEFHKALKTASELFGYSVYLRLDEYRSAYSSGRISEKVLEQIIRDKKGESMLGIWKEKMTIGEYDSNVYPRIGALRSQWKSLYKVNLDKKNHPIIFRLLNNYLDQGISINGFPLIHNGFLSSIRELERNSYVSLFKSKRAKTLFLDANTSIEDLLNILVKEPSLYEQYLFDQQFAHVGWSGMVSVIEDTPSLLLDKREIQLRELILLELIMEIDMLDRQYTENWKPLALSMRPSVNALFDAIEVDELFEILSLWQEAYEWSYYHPVLSGLEQNIDRAAKTPNVKFSALFCIDDRECSFRRYIETLEPGAQTYGTPGFFNSEFYFQPEFSRFHTKVCPAPLSPGYIIVEKENKTKRDKAAHFTKHTHSLLSGWLISQTLGFWSALKLFFNIFRPAIGPATSYSFRHMDKEAILSIENTGKGETIDNLKVGYTIEEMADRMTGLFKSIGLVTIDTPIVYFIGHGASSINNTHYAGYDCGACSGRPGSVNARVAAYMSNHKAVRAILKERGVHISDSTRFVGALHDTTRDEIEYYDLKSLNRTQNHSHESNAKIFLEALDLNAKERSRRFILTNTKSKAEKVHKNVKLRSVTLFEPRPELNHASNALCIVGRRSMSRGLFLDRRAFMNSYDYRVDTEGTYLLNILKAVAPVCGGINLEYYFSRTDNNKLGAGTKLPHNVMGLIGVANGTDGDLRSGLPLQMIEVHEPLRLMVIVENKPDFVLEVIKRSEPTYEWFQNLWIHLIALDPETLVFYKFDGKAFQTMEADASPIQICKDISSVIENSDDNLPVMLLEEHSI